MGAVAASRWACACSTRASTTRHFHAFSPTTRRITCCQTGSPEPLPPFTVSSLSPAASPSSSTLPSSFSSPCLTINRDIQAGEIIEHLGTIMVKGNVNSKAVIHAGGDIVILGQLEGEAHAGRNGYKRAIIFAWHLKSKILSIAGYDAGGGSVCSGGHICKVAFLSNGKVRVEDAGSQDAKLASFTSDHDYAPTRTLYSGAKPWFAIDVKSMRKPSKVAAFTGAYIFIVGVSLLLFPEPLFGKIVSALHLEKNRRRFSAGSFSPKLWD